MKRTIVIWAVAGFVIGGLWALYAAATFPSPLISARPIVTTFIYVTCPIAFASFHFHFRISLYWVLFINAATYSLAGLVLQTFRQQLSPAK